MGNNMRKMYTEQEISNIAQKSISNKEVIEIELPDTILTNPYTYTMTPTTDDEKKLFDLMKEFYDSDVYPNNNVYLFIRIDSKYTLYSSFSMNYDIDSDNVVGSVIVSTRHSNDCALFLEFDFSNDTSITVRASQITISNA